MLRECQHDKDVAKKISLLSTFTNVEDEPETTNYHHVRFDSVFRSTNLPAKPFGVHNTTQPAAAPTVLRAPTTPPPASLPVRAQPPPTSAPAANGSSWTTVTTTGTNGQTANLNKNNTRRYVIINRDNECIDEPIKVDKSAHFSVQQKSRANGQNFCNSMVLRGVCPSGDNCNHNHDVKSLTAAERTAIRQLARKFTCYSDCRDPDCIWGHNCANRYNNEHCDFGNNCRFSHTHSMDLVSEKHLLAC